LSLAGKRRASAHDEQNGCGSCGRLDLEHQETGEIVSEHDLSQRAKSPSADAMSIFPTDAIAHVLHHDGPKSNQDDTEKGEILVMMG
jgi:hypothetical protein